MPTSYPSKARVGHLPSSQPLCRLRTLKRRLLWLAERARAGAQWRQEFALFSHALVWLQHLRRARSHDRLWTVLAAFGEQDDHEQANTGRQRDIGSR